MVKTVKVTKTEKETEKETEKKLKSLKRKQQIHEDGVTLVKKKAKLSKKDKKHAERNDDEIQNKKENTPKSTKKSKKRKKLPTNNTQTEEEMDQNECQHEDTVRVHIGNLKASITQEDLKQYLDVDDVKMCQMKRRRFGFANVNPSKLDSLLEKDGIVIKERTITVSIAHNKPEKVITAGENVKRITLRDLPFDTKEEDILEIFQNAKHVFLKQGNNSMKKFAYGHVTFESPSDARQALEDHQGITMKGVKLDLKLKPHRKSNYVVAPRKTIKISNLRRCVDEHDITELFPDAMAVRFNSTKSRQKAYVEFETVEEAEAAKVKCDNTELYGIVMNVAFSGVPGSQEPPSKKRKT